MKKDDKKLVIGLLIVILFLLIITISLAVIKSKENKTKNIESESYTIVRNNEKSTIYSTKKGIVSTYQELQNLLSELEFEGTDPYSYIPKSSFSNNNFIYYATSIDYCDEEISFTNLTIEDSKVIINFDVSSKCGVCSPDYVLYLFSVDKNQKVEEVETNFNVVSISSRCDLYTVDKPILYLYSEKEMEVNVTLKYSNRILTSYPKYNNGWNVTARPNGDLYDENNNYYYALYWDEENNNEVDFSEGFYVTKDNAIAFLEEKLEIIGLNSKERNEFIMYWLPKLEKNEQSLVYFELTEERQKNNELIIIPKPDSLLRVNMHIKKVDQKVAIQEQKLTTFERIGFTAVEWGGTIHE